jgi:flagellar motor switch protein FliG
LAVKITKSRFVYSPFTNDAMLRIGTALRNSIVERMGRGENVNDQAAKPLKGVTKDKYEPYATQKTNKGLQGIRDLIYSGRTAKAIQVTRVNQNGGIISANNPVADRILSKNNRIEKMFGVSPKDREALYQAVNEELKRNRLYRVETSTTEN